MQAGWYVGEASGLPYRELARFWWGENVPGGEALHNTDTVMAWGGYYLVTILENPGRPNYFDVSLQGVRKATSAYAHDLGRPGFNGEVNLSCVSMAAFATHANQPLRSLEYYYTGTWRYWDTARVLFDGGTGWFFSEDGGDIATSYGYGGGS